jgi:hypothetical protein
VAAQRPTQLTDDQAALVVIDVLADERRALTIGAAMAVSGERSHPATKKYTLKLLDMTGKRSHDEQRVRRLALPSCPCQMTGAIRLLGAKKG